LNRGRFANYLNLFYVPLQCPQNLSPDKQFGEIVEKQIPRRLEPPRDDKSIEAIRNGAAEAAPLQSIST
jgi:hypothetical protein